MATPEVTQEYYNANGTKIPVKVVQIIMPDGTVWDGAVDIGGSAPAPVYTTLNLTGDAPNNFITEGNAFNGARLLNYGDAPCYISPASTPAEGPPSDFLPPGISDGTYIWPGQFNFSHKPVGDWYILSPEDVSVTLITW